MSSMVCVFLKWRWCVGAKLPWLQSFILAVCLRCQRWIGANVSRKFSEITQLNVDGDDQMCWSVARPTQCSRTIFIPLVLQSRKNTCQLIFHLSRYWCKRQGYDYSLYYTTWEFFLVFTYEYLGLFTENSSFEFSFIHRESLSWDLASCQRNVTFTVMKLQLKLNKVSLK